MRRSSVCRALIGVAAASTAISACASSGQGSGSTSAVVYNVGAIASLSGANAGNGLPFIAGIKAYIAYVNKHGGVNGAQINVTAEDDQYSPSAGVAAYRQLITEKQPLVVIGPQSSSVAAVVGPLAIADKTVLVSPAAPEANSPWVYSDSIAPSAALIAEMPLLSALTSSAAKPVRIAFAQVDSPASHIELTAFENASKGKFDVVYSTYPEHGLSSFDTEAAAIAREHVDIVGVNVSADDLPTIVQALRQHGVTVPIVNTYSGSGNALLTSLKDPSLYVFRTFADPSSSEAATMRQQAEAANQPNGTTFANGNFYSQGYATAQLVVNVLKKCGSSCTTAKFASLMPTAASHVDTEGLTGPGTGYTASNHDLVNSVTYFHWDPASNSVVPVTQLPVAAIGG